MTRCAGAYTVFHEASSAYAENVDGLWGALVKVIGKDSEDRRAQFVKTLCFSGIVLDRFWVNKSDQERPESVARLCFHCPIHFQNCLASFLPVFSDTIEEVVASSGGSKLTQSFDRERIVASSGASELTQSADLTQKTQNARATLVESSSSSHSVGNVQSVSTPNTSDAGGSELTQRMSDVPGVFDQEDDFEVESIVSRRSASELDECGCMGTVYYGSRNACDFCRTMYFGNMSMWIDGRREDLFCAKRQVR